MTIYDAGPLAAGPLCGLLILSGQAILCVPGSLLGTSFIRKRAELLISILCREYCFGERTH